jgi:predicted adenylyl cyclase CyaB
MPTNVEIKARVDSIEQLLPVVLSLGGSEPQHTTQDDTFFACPNGRLKLRVTGDGHGVLIFYRRADALGPKSSYFVHSETSDPDGLRIVLTDAYGELGRVQKHRALVQVGHTRIHLDSVDGLGDFLEVEVPLGEELGHEDATREALDLIMALGIEESALIKGAYLDLLSAETTVGS